MALRIGINGFGRMGRLALRAGWNRPGFEWVHINELKGDAATAAHLLTFDSVHGRWNQAVQAETQALIIDQQRLSYSNHAAIEATDWASHNVDLVLECSGKFRSSEQLAGYFAAGVKTVIVAAPVKQGALNIVMGVNDQLYDPQQHRLLTAASCTTNCLAPIVKVVHEQFGIKHGMITTIHDMTNTQNLIDAPHKDLRRARAACQSLIPTSTGSASAIGMIFPELAGRLDGVAIRVPLLNASLTDCVFELAQPTTSEAVNQALAEASRGVLKGILGYEERPLVSVDYKGDPRSAIIDAALTTVTNQTQLKIMAWYDNEIGYVNRMLELAAKVARLQAG